MDGDRMQALLKTMLKDKAIKEIADRYGAKKARTMAYGLAGTQKHAAVAACFSLAGPLAIIVSDQQELNQWKEDLGCLLPEIEVLELPVLDMAEFNAAAKDRKSVV